MFFDTFVFLCRIESKSSFHSWFVKLTKMNYSYNKPFRNVKKLLFRSQLDIWFILFKCLTLLFVTIMFQNLRNNFPLLGRKLIHFHATSYRNFCTLTDEMYEWLLENQTTSKTCEEQNSEHITFEHSISRKIVIEVKICFSTVWKNEKFSFTE